jgi:uncharacterized spore protein YtfJ
MDLQQFLQTLSERFESSANVKRIYGDPVIAEGRTLIPVAKVAYGFGGGSGKKHKGAEPHSAEEGGGGGGGIRATPLGVVEITRTQTRFVSFGLTEKLAAAAAVGFLVGRFLAKRR